MSSTSRNPDGAIGSGEQFHSKIEPSEPMMTGGHQPGKLVGNDAHPEFRAQTLPPGSAPASQTFQPNNASEIPRQADSDSRADPDAEQASAADTIPGATSADVHKGLGKPMQGQTSNELRHDGQHTNKNPGMGGFEGLTTTDHYKNVDPRDPNFAHLRALDKDDSQIGRGNVGGPPAEDRFPETAERVAAENKGK